MQGPRHQFFSGAGLAENANPSLTGGHPLDLRHHPAHRLALPHDFVLAEALTKLAVLGLQPLKLERIVNCEQQLLGRNRLLEKIKSAETGGAHCHLDMRLA